MVDENQAPRNGLDKSLGRLHTPLFSPRYDEIKTKEQQYLDLSIYFDTGQVKRCHEK